MGAPVRLTEGTIFGGDYRVKKPLFEADDRGVYLVEQQSTGRELALKVLSPELLPDDEARTRFLDEAKIGGKVRTVHVLDVRSVGIDDETGLPWVASELLEGENLTQRVAREGKFPLNDWDELLSQVLHGLTAVHGVGVHHGALNGESIFLARPSEVDEPFRVELLDFGVPRTARMKKVSQAARRAWTAPEQLTEGATQTPATDVWAVGLMSFLLLTGKNYFKAASGGGDSAALEQEIRAGVVEPASARARSLGVSEPLPRAFDAWFERCTRLEASDRYPTAQDALEGAVDLLSEVSNVASAAIESLAEPVRAKPKPPPLPPMVRAIAENPKPAIAVIALLIALALGGGFGLGLLRGDSKKGADASRAAATTWSKGSFEAAQKACEAGDPTACHGLGQMYLYGLKVAKDETKASEFFTRACDKNDGPACASQALILISGEGAKRQPARAAELYQKACDRGDAVSCVDLADLYTNGNGIPKNEATAASLRERACKAGLTEVCK